MRYEVSWMLFEEDEQCITSEQFNTLEEALSIYNAKKTEQNVENARIVVILDEYYNYEPNCVVKEIVKMDLCEHGNSVHCQSCEVKQLKYVIEEQQKEIENLKQYKKVLMENSVVRSETIEKYEKALRFYADKVNYELSAEAEKSDLTEFINNLDMDNGEIARKALDGE